jgi:CheY-like chemotaxis protein
MSNLLSGRRVLVVEDEFVILLMMEDIMVDLGCRSVSGVSTVAEAVSLIESEFFDAATLDMNLGGEDSNLVADALLKRGVPFIFCTGNSEADMREGFEDHVVLYKPFRETDLSSALTQLLS